MVQSIEWKIKLNFVKIRLLQIDFQQISHFVGSCNDMGFTEGSLCNNIFSLIYLFDWFLSEYITFLPHISNLHSITTPSIELEHYKCGFIKCEGEMHSLIH